MKKTIKTLTAITAVSAMLISNASAMIEVKNLDNNVPANNIIQIFSNVDGGVSFANNAQYMYNTGSFEFYKDLPEEDYPTSGKVTFEMTASIKFFVPDNRYDLLKYSLQKSYLNEEDELVVNDVFKHQVRRYLSGNLMNDAAAPITKDVLAVADGDDIHYKVVADLDEGTAQFYLNGNSWTNPVELAGDSGINRISVTLCPYVTTNINVKNVKFYSDTTTYIDDDFSEGGTWFDHSWEFKPDWRYPYYAAVQDGKMVYYSVYHSSLNKWSNADFKLELDKTLSGKDGYGVLEFELTPYKDEAETDCTNNSDGTGLEFLDEENNLVIQFKPGNTVFAPTITTSNGNSYGSTEGNGSNFLNSPFYQRVSFFAETLAYGARFKFVIDYETGDVKIYKNNSDNVLTYRNTINIKMDDDTVPSIKSMRFYANSTVNHVVIDNIRSYTIGKDKTSGIGVYDKYDKAVTEAAAGDTVYAYDAIGDTTEAPMSLIAALFAADGTFKSMKFNDVKVPASEEWAEVMNTLEYEIPEEAESGDYVKFMAWNTIDDAVPYSEAVTVTVK